LASKTDKSPRPRKSFITDKSPISGSADSPAWNWIPPRWWAGVSRPLQHL
jgi:hypothetical protein